MDRKLKSVMQNELRPTYSVFRDMNVFLLLLSSVLLTYTYSCTKYPPRGINKIFCIVLYGI